MIDANILNIIEHDGNVEHLRKTRVRTFNNLLGFGRMARMIGYETLMAIKPMRSAK